jgi:hypothetical protein
VVATKKALAFEDDFKRISLEMMAKVYQGFSEEEKRQLPALLVKAIANFD